MSKSLVKYKTLDDETFEAMQKEAEKLSGGKFVKIKVGKTELRVVPGREWPPIVVVMEHFLRLAGGKRVRFVCPRHMAGQYCPSCDRGDALRATGHPDDYGAAGDFIAKFRAYANVVLRSQEDRGPQPLAFGRQIYDDLAVIREDDGDYTDPTDEGFDIIIRRKGTGMEDTEYKVTASKECRPLHDDAATVNEWIEMAKDLRQYSRVPTREQLEAMGVLESEDGGGRRRRRRRGDDEEDERPARKSRSGRRSRRERGARKERTVEDDAVDGGGDDGVVDAEFVDGDFD